MVWRTVQYHLIHVNKQHNGCPFHAKFATSRPKKISDFKIQVQCQWAKNRNHLSISMRAINWSPGSVYLATTGLLGIAFKWENGASECSDAAFELCMSNVPNNRCYLWALSNASETIFKCSYAWSRIHLKLQIMHLKCQIIHLKLQAMNLRFKSWNWIVRQWTWNFRQCIRTLDKAPEISDAYSEVSGACTEPQMHILKFQVCILAFQMYTLKF